MLPIDGELGFNSNMGPVKKLYDEGKMAVIHGIGYENSPRSHFRSMDIWHTCEPDIVGTEGWAGQVIRDLDPGAENVLKGVNFGQGLPRALALRGVPVTSVSSLESYGVLSSVPGVGAEAEREQILERFARMYAPAVGTGPVMDYLGQTGRDALQGADIIRSAPRGIPRPSSTPRPRSPSTCGTSPKSTWPIWEPNFSTPSTAASTPISISRQRTPSCGSICPAPLGTSLTT